MLRRPLNGVARIVWICAALGWPIAISLLILVSSIPWLDLPLGEHSWLFVVLVLLFLSYYAAAGYLYFRIKSYESFLYSPQGRRRREEDVKETVAAIIAEANAKPRLKLDQSLFGAVPRASVMTEARRLAKDNARDELKRRGIRPLHEVDVNELAKITNALIESDLSIIRTAKANLEKRAGGPSVRVG